MVQLPTPKSHYSHTSSHHDNIIVIVVHHIFHSSTIAKQSLLLHNNHSVHGACCWAFPLLVVVPAAMDAVHHVGYGYGYDDDPYNSLHPPQCARHEWW